MRIITDKDMTPQDWRDARQFCLGTIKEVYGFDYRPDWHQDLDDMLGDENVYTTQNGGGFVLVRGAANVVVACGGLRALASRPSLFKQFSQRYKGKNVGALWRAYVTADQRGKGLGTRIKQMRIAAARQLGYDTLYLHASRANPISVTFGQKFGFRVFQEDSDGTVHMEVTLNTLNEPIRSVE